MRQFLAWLLGTYPSQPSSRSRSDRCFVVTEEAGMILGDPFLLHVLQSHLGLASIVSLSQWTRTVYIPIPVCTCS